MAFSHWPVGLNEGSWPGRSLRAVAYGSRILRPLGLADMIVHFESIYAELCMFLT